MKIKNETAWNTLDLKKLFTRCQREVDKIEKTPRHNYNVYIKYDRSGYHGLGCYGYIKVFLPKDEPEFYSTNTKRLALLFIHEYYHVLGYKNQDRLNYRYDWTSKWNVDFASEYIINKKVIVEKPKIDKQITRYQIVLTRIEEWTSQLNRARKALTKYNAKRTRYEKVLVAAGKIKL